MGFHHYYAPGVQAMPTPGGVAFTFSPSDVSPTLWLDPSDLTTMWVERTSPTTQASVDGVVGTIYDKSGNSRHFSAETDAARPVLRQSGSLYYLEFDGVDDTMLGAAGATWASIISTSEHGLILGAEFSTITANPADTSDTVPYNKDAWLSDGSSSNQSYGVGKAADTTVGVVGRIGGAGAYYSLLTAQANGSPFIVTSSHVSGVHTARVNSGPDVTQIAATLQNSGAQMRLGRNSFSASFAAGKFFGVVAKNATLVADLANLRTWMAAKSGVTL